MPADRFCDCGTSDLVHGPDCARWDVPYAPDPAELAAAEDGYPYCRSAIRHPSHAATRRHFKTNPLPKQQSRSAA
ncbi:hypothetical protein [Streptomyces purpureus]|uniref:Uncharacterized protein n=1 Tax=Streptomyces purpureus TaxID=1951 RepID=A0A918LSH1_9ACTN|nr:hypothetical protein [Streptomyces purpureus]GGT43634.1 hypothetical protein GCM10014713_41690 [Streptomyces purpureus]